MTALSVLNADWSGQSFNPFATPAPKALVDLATAVDANNLAAGGTITGPLTTNSNLTFTGAGLLLETAASGIIAGITRTQLGATVLNREVNRVDTSTAPATGLTLGDGVALMAAQAGLDVTVINNTVNTIQVYGNGTDTINGVAGATGVNVAPGDVAQFESAAAGSWNFEAGVGSSGQYDVVLACDNIAAAGVVQGTAAPLTAVMNKVTTATALQGVRLPTSAAGLDIIVENHTGVSIVVYGASTDTIDDVATATGLQQMDSSVVIFTCFAAGKWYTNGAATGYAKNPQSGVVLETVQFADAISAAGANQAGATQLAAAVNTVSTVGAGTGVNLPASSPGLMVTVVNTGLNPLLVYAAQGSADTVNGVAGATGISLFRGVAAVFNCTAAGAWTAQPGTTANAGFNTNVAAAGTTLTAANVTGGAATVYLAMTGALAGAANAQLPTVAVMAALLHSPTPGSSFTLRVLNESSGAFAWSVTTNTGWTLTGTLSIAQNTWRDFVVTLTTLTTATLQNVGAGTFS
jgi:hypothetical protein